MSNKHHIENPLRDVFVVPPSRSTARPHKPISMLISPEDIDLLEHNWHSCGGYAATIRNRYPIKAHRVILQRMLGRPLNKGELCDHINGDILDNRRENLRPVTHSQNHQNGKAIRRDNTSGYRGVSYCNKRKKYYAQYHLNGKHNHVGCFETAEEAGKAVAKAREDAGFFTGNRR